MLAVGGFGSDVDELAAKGIERFPLLPGGLYFIPPAPVPDVGVVVFRNGIQKRFGRGDCLQYGQARPAEILGDGLAHRSGQPDLVRFHADTVLMACDSGSVQCSHHVPQTPGKGRQFTLVELGAQSCCLVRDLASNTRSTWALPREANAIPLVVHVRIYAYSGRGSRLPEDLRRTLLQRRGTPYSVPCL